MRGRQPFLWSIYILPSCSHSCKYALHLLRYPRANPTYTSMTCPRLCGYWITVTINHCCGWVFHVHLPWDCNLNLLPCWSDNLTPEFLSIKMDYCELNEWLTRSEYNKLYLGYLLWATDNCLIRIRICKCSKSVIPVYVYRALSDSSGHLRVANWCLLHKWLMRLWHFSWGSCLLKVAVVCIPHLVCSIQLFIELCRCSAWVTASLPASHLSLQILWIQFIEWEVYVRM